MEDVRGVIFIILCCIVSGSCYAPKRFNRVEEIGIVKVIETHPTELKTWEIIWVDNRQNEHRTFANDTSVFHVGYSMKTLIKL